jgi:hypothetical protein
MLVVRWRNRHCDPVVRGMLLSGAARADWPDHPIKWVVPFGPAARTI